MSPLDHIIAQDWSRPSRVRVQLARNEAQQWREAGRATLEAIVRRLVRRGWTRRRTSRSKKDGRADSRYLQAPGRYDYEIRLSNHDFPHPEGYRGTKDYIVSREIMTTYNVLGILRWIETDLKNYSRPTKSKKD